MIFDQTAVHCNTSGSGTCYAPYCSVTPEGAANYGCGSITRPMNEIFVS